MQFHISLDIETLSVDPDNDAAIIAVGLVVFNPTEILTEHLWTLDPIWTPGSRSQGTYDWWMEQSQGVREEMFDGEILPWNFCDHLAAVLDWNQVEAVWGYPIRFDAGHLRALHKAYGKLCPWTFRQERDLSTLRWLAKSRPTLLRDLEEIKNQNPGAHNALQDALTQARMIQAFLQDWD